MTPPAAYIALAQASMRKWPLSPASVSLGQAQIESHYGQNMPPSSLNPFGIKEFHGPGSVAMTGENADDGTPYRARLAFKVFPSIEAAFDFHGRLLATDQR